MNIWTEKLKNKNSSISSEGSPLPVWKIETEDGDTPTIGINHKHRNIIDLNYVNLGTVIQSMIHGFQNDRYIRLTRGKLKQLLADTYEQNRLNIEELAPSVLHDIEKTVAARRNAS